MSKLIFSDKLRSLMDGAGVTQEQFARGVGVSQGAVSGWMNGAMPSADKLNRIASFFKTTVQALLSTDEAAEGLTEPATPYKATDWRTRALNAEEELRRLQRGLLEMAETILTPAKKS